MLSVDDFVPLPIVGNLHEVVVGELQSRIGRPHVIAPWHRLILAREADSGPLTLERDLRRNPCHGSGRYADNDNAIGFEVRVICDAGRSSRSDGARTRVAYWH